MRNPLSVFLSICVAAVTSFVFLPLWRETLFEYLWVFWAQRPKAQQVSVVTNVCSFGKHNIVLGAGEKERHSRRCSTSIYIYITPATRNWFECPKYMKTKAFRFSLSCLLVRFIYDYS